LHPPRGSAGVQVQSSAPVAVSARIRPGNLPHKTRVPDDYEIHTSPRERTPFYFGLGPLDATELRRKPKRYLFVNSYPEPPEETDRLAVGTPYLWEDFAPTYQGIFGYPVLVERDVDGPSRDEALSAIFVELLEGEPAEIALVSPEGIETPNRKLIFSREKAEPAVLNVRVGGISILRKKLLTRQGEFNVPGLPPGPVELELKLEKTSPDEGSGHACRFFVNYVDPRKAPILRTFLYRFEGPLEFLVEKKLPEEMLNVRILAPLNQVEPYTIRAHLEPANPRDRTPIIEKDSSTFLSREFVIQPSGGKAVLLGDESLEYDAGRKFFVPLDPNLPAGIYRLKLVPGEGFRGLVSVNRINPGEYSDIRFHREPQ
ncbi:MAG: hypothetical protein HKN23_09820, partial [Verrucomicrobiales bacterium]|nr:hypothetical protein [Verrucomicrobiales bacterium]